MVENTVNIIILMNRNDFMYDTKRNLRQRMKGPIEATMKIQ